LYEREERNLNILFFPEILEHIAQLDHALSKDQGSVLLVGRSGVGRRTATSLVAHMRGMKFFTLNVQDNYTRKHFYAELKTMLACAGVENESVVFYVEDHQMLLGEVLESINSLLSSGEVPGLYKHEELGPLLEPLREEMQDVGGFRTPYDFFIHRIRNNLHIALAMDPNNPSFELNCESNPALYTRCAILWMGQWSRSSLMALPEMLLPKMFDLAQETCLDDDSQQLLQAAVNIHASQCASSGDETDKTASPRDYIAFLSAFETLYQAKRGGVEQSIRRLQSGLSKLQDAAVTVDELSGAAKEKAKELKIKQDTADKAMDQITDALEQASERRKEVQVLREEMQDEQKKTEKQKNKIQAELKDVQPILEQAQKAVGGIKSDNLNEIKHLKMPPEAIHDVLSAVLMLLGIRDTSWLSMKKFLGQRGVKDEILNYDAHQMTPEIRKSVGKVLRSKASSFDDANIYRVSVAAAPMALWVKANIRYSLVLEKIEPLERDLAEANRVLQRSQDRLAECQGELDQIDNKVKELKNVFKVQTREAESLRHFSIL
jgi:dynein heavy chain 2